MRVIRRVRTGKSAPASVVELHRELVATLDAYANRHPDVSTEQMREAVERTLLSIIRA